MVKYKRFSIRPFSIAWWAVLLIESAAVAIGTVYGLQIVLVMIGG